MSQPTNCYGTSQRCQVQQQINLTKTHRLEQIFRLTYSVILLMVIQATHTKGLDLARHSRGEQRQIERGTQALFELDPIVFDTHSLYNSHERHRRAAVAPTSNQKFVDACQSKMEVLTPYYATNSKGKLRTIVNSELMQQAIQIESCVR